jgi:hypothetical protein
MKPFAPVEGMPAEGASKLRPVMPWRAANWA